MSISRDKINEIRDRASIEEVIARYVPSLKKRGNNFIGLCPFHREKTPSFTVSPDKQIYHCFGCHEGGNVFTFISKIEKVDFPESVKIVGKLIGIEIDDKKSTPESTKAGMLVKINDYAAKVFTKFLHSDGGKNALEYLRERGVNSESIEKFRLGYCPDEWDFIKNKLIKHQINLDFAVETGLLTKKEENNHYYDRFRSRVIFPIFDRYGNIVAFGGRITGEGEPKYLNSPESDIFKKRSILYGFNFARDYIRECSRVIVVEGYLDVIGCHQAGIMNTVAPLGTALTEEHVVMLSHYASEIIFLFDSDGAGLKASLRSLTFSENVNAVIKVAMLPSGDPFDFVKSEGPRKLMALIDNAVYPADFKIEMIFRRMTSASDGEKLKNLFMIIDEIDSEVEKQQYLKKISSKMEIDYNALLRDYSGRKTSTGRKNSAKIANKRYNFTDKSYIELIILLVNYPEIIQKAVIDFSENEITDGLIRGIYKKTVNFISGRDNFEISEMFDIFDSVEEIEFINKYITTDYNIEDPDSVYTEIYINNKLYSIENKIEYYCKKMLGNESSASDYLTEIEILRREKEKLQNYVYNVKINSKDKIFSNLNF
ncbi:MAG: DNA primase [Spirochaetes bacterium]|nr:DNA primase [Spirochaetota bacterium]